MNDRRNNFILGTTLIFGLLLVVSLTWHYQSEAASQSIQKQQITTPDIEHARQNSINASLGRFLAKENLSLNEEALHTEPSSNFRTYRVRLESSAKRSDGNKVSERKEPVKTVKLVSRSDRRSGTLPQKRTFELSATQIVIVAVGASDQVVWWDLIPDPRILRAETSDSSGKISGRTLFRRDTELFFHLPSNDAITMIRFYSPIWNGHEFSLDPIGATGVIGDRDD